MAKLLTSYCISITKYIAMLYQVWCSYHNYVRKVIKVKILWHHNGPFSSSSGHSSYFFKGASLSFSCPTCYPRLFRMLGFNHSCTSFSFPTRWSFYFFWCNGTCRDRYLSLLGRTIGYPCIITWGCSITCLAFRKSNGAILSSNVIFFYGPTTQVGIYFNNKCSFGCHASTYLFLCKSNNMGLVNTHSFHLSFTHFFYSTPYLFQYNTSHSYTSFTLSCGHTINDLGIHLLHCSCGSECIVARDMLQNIVVAITSESGAQVQRKVSHLFPHCTWRQLDIFITRDNFKPW